MRQFLECDFLLAGLDGVQTAIAHSLLDAAHTAQELKARPDQHRLRCAPVDLRSPDFDQFRVGRRLQLIVKLVKFNARLVANAQIMGCRPPTGKELPVAGDDGGQRGCGIRTSLPMPKHRRQTAVGVEESLV